ncbi:NAD(P)H-hydrate epimerase, partial [Candidatus Cyanaurora vandensis]
MNPDRLLVTAAQMQAVEDWTFNRGLPVAGLMERAGLRLTETILDTYPGLDRVGVLVGPGHNGADALVVARELHLLGLTVQVFVPVNPLKPLTQDHLRYYQAIGGRVVPEVQELRASSLLVDGLFGSGLTRALAPELAQLVDTINHWGLRVVSLDLPSGLESDTGAVLGTAIRAERTFCLGLWKQGLFEDRALEYCGTVTRLDLGLPMAALQAVLPEPQTQRITPDFARAGLPLNRPLAAHKYTVGRLLVVAGSRQFTGAALLTGLG